MTIQRFLIVLMKWLAAFALASGIVMLIRLFCIESYRISTDSMEEALHKGDYILVNKIPGKNKPVRGKVVLFTSPLSRDSADAPLFISRCIGMPEANCAYVGDNPVRDVEGTQAAGFGMMIRIDEPDTLNKEKATGKEFTPDHVITSLSELLDIFPERA